MKLEEIKKIYEENEIAVHYDDEGAFVVTIKDELRISDFIPIAIKYFDHFCELEGPYILIIKNGKQETSEEIFMNMDSELD